MPPSKADPLARVPRHRIGARRKQITNVPYMFFFGSRKADAKLKGVSSSFANRDKCPDRGFCHTHSISVLELEHLEVQQMTLFATARCFTKLTLFNYFPKIV
jgi:hypothetical protein